MGFSINLSQLPMGEKMKRKQKREWKKKARELVRLKKVTHNRKNKTQISKKSCTGGSVAQYEM